MSLRHKSVRNAGSGRACGAKSVRNAGSRRACGAESVRDCTIETATIETVPGPGHGQAPPAAKFAAVLEK